MVFTFLNVWETSKEYFVTHENDKKFRLNEVVSQHSRGHSLACHLRLRSSRSRIVGEKPEVFTTWPFAEEVCRGRSEGSFFPVISDTTFGAAGVAKGEVWRCLLTVPSPGYVLESLAGLLIENPGPRAHAQYSLSGGGPQNLYLQHASRSPCCDPCLVDRLVNPIMLLPL